MPDNGGQLVDVGGRKAVRFARTYSASRADVWSAITERDRTARWSFPVEIEPRVGGRLRFDLGELDVSEGTVLEWDKPSVLECEWTEDGTPWRTRFELDDAGDGETLLTFHNFLPNPTRPEFAAGWHWYMDRLGQLLAGSPPASVVTDEHFDDLMRTYRSALADGS